MSFKCNQCGECCRNIGGVELYKDLDNGNGVCKYLVGNLCSIYNERPILCRVDESYELFFKHIDKEDYYNANYAVCKLLKEKTEKSNQKE